MIVFLIINLLNINLLNINLLIMMFKTDSFADENEKSILCLRFFLHE